MTHFQSLRPSRNFRTRLLPIVILVVLVQCLSLQQLSAQPLNDLDSIYAPFPLPATQVTNTTFTMNFVLRFGSLIDVRWFSYQISPDSTFRAITWRGDYLGTDSTKYFRVDSLVREPWVNLKVPILYISLPISDMQPATTYFYRARARLLSGDIIFSGDRFLNTLGKVTTFAARAEPVPLLLLPKNIGSSEFFLSWERVQGAQGYEVDIALDSTFTRLVSGYASLRLNTPQVRVQGLTPQTPYFCRVRSVAATGTSAYSSSLQVSTLSLQQPYRSDIVGMSRVLNNTLGPTATSATSDLVYSYPTTDMFPTSSQIDSTLRLLLSKGVPLDSALVIDNNGCMSNDVLPNLKETKFSRFIVRFKAPLQPDSIYHKIMLQSGFLPKTLFTNPFRLGWQPLCGCRGFQFYHTFDIRVSVREEQATPLSLQCSPNPASDEAVCRYSLASGAAVQLTITDVFGRTVLNLEEGFQSAGEHQTLVDVRTLPSGVYLVRLQAGGQVQTAKVLVVR